MISCARRAFRTFAVIAGLSAGSAALGDGHAALHLIEIEGMAFSPSVLTINVGDTVVVVNRDSAPHTATGQGDTFATGQLGQGEEVALTFTAAGVFDYFCTIHPRMTAQIVVE